MQLTMLDDYATLEPELLNTRPKRAMDKFWEMVTGGEESTIHDESDASHASSYDEDNAVSDFEEEDKFDKGRGYTSIPGELLDGQNGKTSKSLGGSPNTRTHDKGKPISVKKAIPKNPSSENARTKTVTFCEKSTAKVVSSKQEYKTSNPPMGLKNQQMQIPNHPVRSKKDKKASILSTGSRIKSVKPTLQLFGSKDNQEEKPSTQPMGSKNERVKSTTQPIDSKNINPKRRPLTGSERQTTQETQPTTEMQETKASTDSRNTAPTEMAFADFSCVEMRDDLSVDLSVDQTMEGTLEMSVDSHMDDESLWSNLRKTKSTKKEIINNNNNLEEKPSAQPACSTDEKVKSVGSKNKQEEKPSTHPIVSQHEKVKSTTQFFSKNEKEEKPSTQPMKSKDIKPKRRPLNGSDGQAPHASQPTTEIQETKAKMDSRNTAPTEMSFANFSSAEMSVDLSVDQTMEGTLEMSVDSHMGDESVWNNLRKTKSTKEEMKNNSKKLPSITETENSHDVNKESLCMNISKAKSTKQVKNDMEKSSSPTESENAPSDEKAPRKKWQRASKLLGFIWRKKTDGKSAETKSTLATKADQPTHTSRVPQSDQQFSCVDFKPSVIKKIDRKLRTASPRKNDQQRSEAKPKASTRKQVALKYVEMRMRRTRRGGTRRPNRRYRWK